MKRQKNKGKGDEVLILVHPLIKYFSSNLHHLSLYALFLPVFSFLASNSRITGCNQNITLLYVLSVLKLLHHASCYLRLVLSTLHMHLTVLLVVNLYFCTTCNSICYVVIISLIIIIFLYTLFFWIDLNSALMKAVSWSSWDVISWRSISLLTLVKNLLSQ